MNKLGKATGHLVRFSVVLTLMLSFPEVLARYALAMFFFSHAPPKMLKFSLLANSLHSSSKVQLFEGAAHAV